MGLQSKTFSELVTFTRASSATVTDSTGTIVESGVDEPRFDYDPVTGERLGLLIEEARTNYAARSNSLTGWALGVSAVPVPSIFSGQLATKLTNNTGIGNRSVSKTTGQGSFTAAKETLVVIAEAVDSDSVDLGLRNVSGASWELHLRLTSFTTATPTLTTTVSDATDIASGLELLAEVGPNGGRVWKIWASGVPVSTNTRGTYVYPTGASGAAESVIVHHFQNEVGAFPTSPIITPVNFTSRASVANYFDENGDLQEAAVDESRPHYIYDADADEWVGGALLYEEARTNFLPYNLHLRHTSITKSGVSVSESADRPAGGALGLGYKITPSTTNGRQGLYWLVSQAVRCALTVYAKADGYGFLYLGCLRAANSRRGGYYFDLSGAGSYIEVAGSTIGQGAIIENVGGGFYRCTAILENDIDADDNIGRWIVATAPTNATGFDPLHGEPSFTGDGSSGVIVYSPQAEAGAFPTSPIHTPTTFTSRASTGNYFDASGVLQEAAIDVERPHYIYDAGADEWIGGALLYEGAATNSLLHNRNLTNAAWTKELTPVYTQNAVGIDGAANTAWNIEDLGGSFSGFSQTVTVANDGATHTASVYVKKDSDISRVVELNTQLSGGAGHRAHQVSLNTATGAMGTRANTASDDAWIEDAGEWWRIVNTITNNSTGNTTFNAAIYPAVGPSVGVVDAATTGSAIIDFPQVELNATYPTSPIETTTTAVTRSADVVSSAAVTRSADVVSSSAVTRAREATRTPFADNFDVSNFTAVIEGYHRIGARIVAYTNGSTANRLIFSNGTEGGFSGYASSTAEGVSVNNFTTSVAGLAEGDRFRMAVSVSDGTLRMVVNGGTIISATPTTRLPNASDGIDTRDIGHDEIFSVSGYTNSATRVYKEYPYAMSDAELIAASTL